MVLPPLSRSFVCASLLCAAPSFAQTEEKVARPLPPAPPDKIGFEAPATSGTGSSVSAAVPATRRARTGATRGPAIDFLSIQEPGDGRTWVRGADYKASFGPEGATFIPFFGSDAPRNFPVRFALASVDVGGETLAFDETACVTRNGERIVLERGDVDEHYDVALTGIEHTVVVERLPALGALRVEIAFESELEPAQVGDGLEFANGYGSVCYGGATVIDANGATHTSPSRLADGRIRIDVPAPFLANARLPLRVDPFLSVRVLASAPEDEFHGDLAFDATNGRWCATYEHVYSAADHDVMTILTNVDGLAIPGQEVWADYTSDSWIAPAIANNAIADNFLVAAEVRPVGGGSSIVRCITRSAASTTIGTQTTVNGSELGAKHSVDVGGDPHPVAPTYYFVVWQRDFGSSDTDIHGRLVGSDGVPLGPAFVSIDNSSPTLDRSPRISNSDGAPPASTQEWNVVWTRDSDVSFGRDIRGAQVHWDGIVSTPSFAIDTSIMDDAAPSVSSPLDRASGPRPYLVAYSRNLLTGDWDLQGRVLVGATQTAGVNLSVNDAQSVSEGQFEPDVDSDGSQFMVAFTETAFGNPSNLDLFVSSFWYADGTLSINERHVNYDALSNPVSGPRIWAAHSSGISSLHYGMTWALGGASSDMRIGMGLMPAYVAPDPYCEGDGTNFTCPCSNPGTFGNGCEHSANANGAKLASSDGHVVQGDTSRLIASQLPSGAPVLFFQGTAPAAAPFGDGYLCISGTITRLGVVFASGTQAEFPNGGPGSLASTGQVPSIGGIRYYQAWFRDSAPFFCTPSTFNLTNGLRIVWLP